MFCWNLCCRLPIHAYLMPFPICIEYLYMYLEYMQSERSFYWHIPYTTTVKCQFKKWQFVNTNTMYTWWTSIHILYVLYRAIHWLAFIYCRFSLTKLPYINIKTYSCMCMCAYILHMQIVSTCIHMNINEINSHVVKISINFKNARH